MERVKETENSFQIVDFELPADLELELDPEHVSRKRAERRRYLNVVQVPALRIFGFGLLAVGVVLHNRLIQGSVHWPSMLHFTLIVMAYSLISWLVLRTFFDRVHFMDLGDLFLGLDIVFYVLAIYYTGGDESWAFFIVLIRVADQVPASTWRTLLFAHLGVLGFVLLLLYLAFVEDRPVSWPAELAKVFFLYLTALYICSAARPSQRRRRRTSMAVRTSRKLIDQLARQSRQLQEQRARAEEASAAKSVFLSTMSHEIRTPLAVIIGHAELLQTTEDPDARRRYLANLSGGANTLFTILTDILDFTALDTATLTVEDRPFELVDTLTKALEPMVDRAGNKGLELESEIDTRLPPVLRGDPQRLGQVLSHLLGNAIKFTHEGTVRLLIQPWAEDPSGRTVRFEIKDTGVGFEIDSLESLLEPFFQADGSTTRRYGGTGIGLAIVRAMVEAMGGTFGAKSAPGEGSTFSFELPLIEPTPGTVQPS